MDNEIFKRKMLKIANFIKKELKDNPFVFISINDNDFDNTVVASNLDQTGIIRYLEKIIVPTLKEREENIK